MKNRKIVNRIEGEVLDCRMVMTVRLPEGTIVKVNGNQPRGSIIDLWATDISRSGQLMGYEGYEIIERALRKHKATAKVIQTNWFEDAMAKATPKQEVPAHVGHQLQA